MFRSTVAAVLMALSALAAGAQPPPNNKPQNSIRITQVNIGAGLCTVIECPGQQAQVILYDCGSSGRGDTGLTRAQAAAFVNTIRGYYNVAPKVVVSHPDGDHYNYITTIMGNGNAASIWLGAQVADYNATFRTWLQAQQQAGVAVNTFQQGASNNTQPVAGLACGTANTFVLTANAGAEDNAKSVVLRIVHGQFSATLTGDATAESLASILSNYRGNINGLATTFLGAPHHGSESEGSNSFVWPQVFQPRIVAYSAGERYFHPRCSAVDVYDDANTLRNAQNHPLQCGDEGAYWDDPHANAQYLTASDGSLWVVSDGQNTLEVTCNGGVNCALN